MTSGTRQADFVLRRYSIAQHQDSVTTHILTISVFNTGLQTKHFRFVRVLQLFDEYVRQCFFKSPSSRNVTRTVATSFV